MRRRISFRWHAFSLADRQRQRVSPASSGIGERRGLVGLGDNDCDWRFVRRAHHVLRIRLFLMAV